MDNHPIERLLIDPTIIHDHIWVLPLDIAPGFTRRALSDAFPELKNKSLIVELYRLKRFDVIELILKETNHQFWCNTQLFKLPIDFYCMVLKEARERQDSLSPNAFRAYYNFTGDIVEIGEQGHTKWLFTHLVDWCDKYAFGPLAIKVMTRTDFKSVFFSLDDGGHQEGDCPPLEPISALDYIVRFMSGDKFERGILKLYLTRHTLPQYLNRSILAGGRSIRTKMNQQGTKPAGSFTCRFLMYLPLLNLLVRELAIQSTYEELAEFISKADLVCTLVESKCEFSDSYELVCLMTDGGFGSTHPQGSKERVTFEHRMKVRVCMEKAASSHNS
jgi:hypothetical protein